MTGPTTRSGLTVIELIIAVAIAGVLLAVGAAQLNMSGSATRQAAEVVAGAECGGGEALRAETRVDGAVDVQPHEREHPVARNHRIAGHQ